MRLTFYLLWGKGKKRLFGAEGAQALFEDYVQRLGRLCPCPVEIKGGMPSPGISGLWVCHPGPSGRGLSSEDLAQAVERRFNVGGPDLGVVVGGPDGVPVEALQEWKPDLIWSFGPLTLPHELAAVVAAEQMYRAWTILKGSPYHLGH